VVVLENASLQPSAAPTPLPISLPLEKVSIQRPGPGAQITSPVRVTGRAGPTWNNGVLLRLIGEDGRVIIEKKTTLFSNPGNAGLFSETLSFETPAVAESARLEVHNFSRRDGKLDHIGSVHVILLSVGAERMYWDIQGAEQLTVLTPEQEEIVQGGSVLVHGAGWVVTDVPLKIEIYNRLDELVGNAETRVQSDAPGVLGYFDVDVPYQVDVEQLGRIVVYEPDGNIPGIRHLTSLYVYLKP